LSCSACNKDKEELAKRKNESIGLPSCTHPKETVPELLLECPLVHQPHLLKMMLPEPYANHQYPNH